MRTILDRFRDAETEALLGEATAQLDEYYTQRNKVSYEESFALWQKAARAVNALWEHDREFVVKAVQRP